VTFKSCYIFSKKKQLKAANMPINGLFKKWIFKENFNNSLFSGVTHPFWQVWDRHRLLASKLIENKYFEGIVLILILISSFVMTLEDIWFETKHSLIDLLYYLDRILTVVFFLETTLKLFAMGFVVYFSNAWCWLDFVIVAVSLVNFGASLLGAGNISIFKTMRTLRALRPLRAMAKMEGKETIILY
jgi:voltage-gated sodium channel type II alpha